MSPVRFMRHYVEANGVKARVSYSACASYGTPGNERAVVVLYAKDYSSALAKVARAIGDGLYTNNTEIQSDYHEHGHVVLDAAHPLYASALAMAQANKAKDSARWEADLARRQAKSAAIAAERKARWDAAVAARRAQAVAS